MKFVSLIASTLLIVLISQDLTQGLPVEDTTVQNSCPEGSELINGNCVPMDSTSNVSVIESSTVPVQELSGPQGKSATQTEPSAAIAPCPFGMGRGKNGICRERKLDETMEVTTPSSAQLITELNHDQAIESTAEPDMALTTVVTGVNEGSSSGNSLNDCPEGTRRNSQGVCKRLRSSKMTKVTTESMDDSTTEFPTDLTTELIGDLSTVSDTESAGELTTEETGNVARTPSRGPSLNSCPEGMKLNRQGVCKSWRSSKMTKVTTPSMDELTTEFPTDLTTELIGDLSTVSHIKSAGELPTEETGGVDRTPSRGVSLNSCPKGMKLNRQGVCKPWTSSKMTKVITPSMDEFATEFPTDLTTELVADLSTVSDIESAGELTTEETGDVGRTPSRGASLKSCPRGMKLNTQGVCKPWRSSKMTKVTTESMDDSTTEFPTDLTTELIGDLSTVPDIESAGELTTEETGDVDRTPSREASLKSCPRGMKPNTQGICKKIKSSRIVEATTPSVDDLSTESNGESEIELTTEWASGESSDIDTTTRRWKNLKICPRGMKQNKQGVCKPLGSSNTIEDNTQSIDETTPESAAESTAEDNETPSQQESLKDCPAGTERDEQGTCEKIKSTNLDKAVTDPKVLLKTDGSCPENYVMVQGRCLYTTIKSDSTSFPGDSQSNDYASTAIKTVEPVPVLSDNSCPEGTEYSEHGLCQKRVTLPISNRLVTVDGRCPENYELVNGKCLPRNIKTHIKSKSTTPRADSAESIDDDEVPKSTSTVKSTADLSDME